MRTGEHILLLSTNKGMKYYHLCSLCLFQTCCTRGLKAQIIEGEHADAFIYFPWIHRILPFEAAHSRHDETRARLTRIRSKKSQEQRWEKNDNFSDPNESKVPVPAGLHANYVWRYSQDGCQNWPHSTTQRSPYSLQKLCPSLFLMSGRQP